MIQEIHKSKIGDFNCTIFKDLMFNYGVKDYFNNVEQDQLSDALNKYSITSENLEVPYIAMLLERGNQKILIDSGIGFSDEPIQFGGADFFLTGNVTKLLEKEGVNRTDITDVIISHFHPDHIGGIFSKGVLNYPNATFHLPEKEWNFWHSSSVDNYPPLFKLFIDNHITPLKSHNVNLIKGDFTTILPDIVAVNAGGHSAGQIALIIGKEKNQLLYAADTFLHPLHIENMDWQSIFDFDHKASKDTRSKLATLAYEGDMLIQSFHFDFPGLGKIRKEKLGWEWKYLK